MFRATERAAPKIRTRGQAEEIGSRLFVVGGTTAGIGLLLCLTIVLAWLGVVLIAAGALIVLGSIGWGFWLMNHSTEEIRCPSCHKENVVFGGVPDFACEDCGRTLAGPASGHSLKGRVPV